VATVSVEIVFETHSMTQRISEPFPGGESYRQVVGRVQSFLSDLSWDGSRVVVVGHSATQWALDHLLSDSALDDLVEAPFAWQQGWFYVLTL
jgi:broad specificity phosphatase PhoE